MLRATLPCVADPPQSLGKKQSEDGEEQACNFVPKRADGAGERFPESFAEAAGAAGDIARDHPPLLRDNPPLGRHLRGLRAGSDDGILRLGAQCLGSPARAATQLSS